MEGEVEPVYALTGFVFHQKIIPVMVKSLFSIAVNVGMFIFYEMNLKKFNLFFILASHSEDLLSRIFSAEQNLAK